MSNFKEAFDSIFEGKEVFRLSSPSVRFFHINGDIFCKLPNGNRLAWTFNREDFESLDWVIAE